MRTFAEQKEVERKLRRTWLMDLVQTGKSLSELAQMAGCDRAVFYKMAKRLDVEMPRRLRGPKTDTRPVLPMEGEEPPVVAVKKAVVVKKKAEAPKPVPKPLTPLERMKLDAQAANKRLRGGK